LLPRRSLSRLMISQRWNSSLKGEVLPKSKLFYRNESPTIKYKSKRKNVLRSSKPRRNSMNSLKIRSRTQLRNSLIPWLSKLTRGRRKRRRRRETPLSGVKLAQIRLLQLNRRTDHQFITTRKPLVKPRSALSKSQSQSFLSLATSLTISLISRRASPSLLPRLVKLSRQLLNLKTTNSVGSPTMKSVQSWTKPSHRRRRRSSSQ